MFHIQMFHSLCYVSYAPCPFNIHHSPFSFGLQVSMIDVQEQLYNWQINNKPTGSDLRTR